MLHQSLENSRRRAGSGLSRRSGSQIKHFAMKSMNNSSSDLSTCAKLFVEGRRRRPFELTTGRGAPVESAESPGFRRRARMSAIQLTEEQSFTRRAIDEMFVRQTHHFHDASELLLFILARENRVPCVHLCNDTAETPHLRSVRRIRSRSKLQTRPKP